MVHVFRFFSSKLSTWSYSFTAFINRAAALWSETYISDCFCRTPHRMIQGKTTTWSRRSVPDTICDFVKHFSFLFCLCIETEKWLKVQNVKENNLSWQWKKEVASLCSPPPPVNNLNKAASLQPWRTESLRAVGPDGCRARPVFSGVHHPADVGFLRRVRTVAGFLLPQHL